MVNTCYEFIKPISLQGLNGGLSLRVVNDMVSLLDEFPQLVELGKERRIGEDIFFYLLSRLTRKGIFFPIETLASQFAVTCNFKEWWYLSAKLSACDAVRGNIFNINCFPLMAQ